MLAALALLAATGGCQDPLPIPRIEPSLEGWAAPYAGLDGLEVHAFRTGAVRSVEAATFAGGSWTSAIEMGVWAFVISHPTRGLVVFDTGLSERARSEPEHYVGWLGARLGMLDVPEGAGLAAQMTRAGLDPGDVNTVILSHLHFDHTGGIGDFPSAEIVVGSAERDWVKGGVAWSDFVDVDALADVDRWRAIDYQVESPLATFFGAHDLFGDGSLVVLDLSGHTPGSQGLLVRTAQAPILLTGDAAWTEKSWRWSARPISAYDMNLWWEQAWRVRKFAMLEPLLVVIPGHDDRTVAEVGIAAFRAHDLEPVAAGEAS